jgi:hypothetical protein
MKFLEHEGALYRGISRSHPKEVWHPDERRFVPYQGTVPKAIEWGYEISTTEAMNIMMGSNASGEDAYPRRHTRRRQS